MRYFGLILQAAYVIGTNMRILLKELEKVIAFVRKNSPDEYLIIKVDEISREFRIMVSDLEAKNMIIIMYDDETAKTADIIKSSKL